MEFNAHTITYDDRGLVPVIVQDAETDQVLMLAYADSEAIERTIAQGRVWFYSRSRNEYWLKGETSGNVLQVKEMFIDCDNDAVLIKVEVLGEGVACHTGAISCFYTKI